MQRIGMFIAATALAAAPALALAQSWVFLASAEGEWDAYYDTTRQVRNGTIVRVWLKRQLAQEQRGISYYLSQAEIDCGEETARILFTSAHAADGDTLARDPEPVPAEPIPPGSFFATLQGRVC